MANLPVLNGAGATVYLKSTGVGSDADPHIPEHTLGPSTNNIGDADVLTLVGDSPDLDTGAGTDNHAGVAILLPASGGHVVGGTGADPIRTDPVASTVQPVSIASMYVPATVLASIPNVPSVAIASNNVPGNARAASAVPAPVADAAVVQIMADLTGAAVFRPYTIPELILNGSIKGSGATTAQVLLAAQGSGYRAYITDWHVVNPSGSHGTDVCLHDGTATIAIGHAAKDGGGFAFRFGVPLKPAVNGTISLIALTASSPLLVNVSGYKGI